jgi:ribokinase
MTVLVLGSINMDLVVRASRLPQSGETLTGSSFTTVPGGKGANQAVAAARLGAKVQLVGRVGADLFGVTLFNTLRTANVDTSAISEQPGVASGVALIQVDDAGANTIVVVPGANHELNHHDLLRFKSRLDGAKVVLLQLEVPLNLVTAAAQLAQQAGVTVILDPAPAVALPAELYQATTILTPNEHEASVLVGFPVNSVAAASAAAEVLATRGPQTVIITLGGAGAVVWRAGRSEHLPAWPVQAIDSVAAGDAFNGALAAALASDLSFEVALDWARAAGAITVTRQGAQPSLPTLADVQQFLQTNDRHKLP